MAKLPNLTRNHKKPMSYSVLRVWEGRFVALSEVFVISIAILIILMFFLHITYVTN